MTRTTTRTRTLSTIAVALPLFASLGIGAGSATAQVSVDLSYQGTLEIDSVPETTTVNLRLGVFDDGASVNCLDDPNLNAACGNYSREVTDIPVEAGRFSASLNGVPVSALEGAVSLAVAVEGASGDFIILGVQPLKAVASSAHAKQAEVALDGLFAPPVGSIIAWNPSAVGLTVADLPENWVPCNGQVASGIPIPNLNGPRRFLRGGNTDGVFEQDAMQGHTHVDSGHSHTVLRPRHFANETTSGNSMYATTDFSAVAQVSTTNPSAANLGGPTPFGGNGTPRVANETRPANMSVIWIMRVR